MTEPLLAFLHLSAILAWVVFASSQAALCRAEWFNADVVRRLGRLDVILWVATAVVLLTGLVRIYGGAKGAGWYWGNGLLHLKLTLLVVVMGLMLATTRRLRRWRASLAAGGALPTPEDMRAARRSVMIATHLFALIPLAAVFMARGYGA